MAASNTKFKVEHGLDVTGSANVSGTLRVEGDLVVGGNLASALNITGDLKPTANHTYNLGTGLLRWTVFGSSGDFSNNFTVAGDTTLNNASVANLISVANGAPLGTATRRWNMFANSANVMFITVDTSLAVQQNSSVNSLFVNNTTLSVVSGNVTINTGSKSAIVATGNSTYSNLSLNNDVTAIAGNVAFDTDLVFFDAVNNRVGFKNTTPSSSALVTITGNVEFSVANTGVRLNTGTSSINGSIMMVANSTNSRFTFATYDNSNSSVQDGGYVFSGVNATSTQSLLSFNSYNLQYKSANVAHAGNFGIYNVSGTRVGP
jgi:hypothetical protein